ncbi:MAG: isoprenylcysteine carboxylmethyltransferase family protein [candidate division Zixibacteria bacterium]|nr:isoprenylcysteine carboxylmethyltransferase family protein [candidate division Zixibacteria bacterium]
MLILLHLNHWFHEPWSIHQMVSWLLLFASTGLVLHGAWLLKVVGKPDSTRDDPSLIGIEKTTKLVKAGVYRYIRHPIYSSLIGLGWGVCFKQPSLVGVSLALITTALLTIAARIEEIENRRFFGSDYECYMKKTKMFIPYLF